MREWPKTLYAEAEGDVYKMVPWGQTRSAGRPDGYPFEEEVVLKDLAQELYEALKFEMQDFSWSSIAPSTREVLTRYKEEVGE